MATAPEPLKVVRGSGVWLELADGRRIIDAVSSWWVNLHGHARPEIAEAIHRQALELEHVIFAGFTHEPAERLAAILVEALPGTLNRVFFSDNGSTAIEVAVKMAVQAAANRGERRHRVVAFEGAYHGDTFGAMAAGERSVFSAPFEEMLFRVDRVPYPATWDGDDTVDEKEAEAIAALRSYLERHSDETALVLVEPLIQGAGGMRMARTSFFRGVEALCREYRVLLAFDEVMTGFGRTGQVFACLKCGVTPDLICLSKGITGGFLPLSVTVASEAVYAAFHSDDAMKALYHGHSYTANPLGCAAALASWDILAREAGGFRGMEVRHRSHLEKWAGHPLVEKLRVCGTVAAFDIKSSAGGYFDAVGPKLKAWFPQHGVLLRPLGNTIYLMPPYVISDDELAEVYRVIGQALDHMEQGKMAG